MDGGQVGIVLEYGREVIRIEARAVAVLEQRIDESFARAVETILECTGKVIVTGVGKSGIIGHKIAATLACAGVPAVFMHAAEALHGDVGMVQTGDVVIAISNSGESDEFRTSLLPVFHQLGVKVIGFTGNPQSTLARNSDVVLDIGVEREACPLGISATASSTATLAMGDALAMVAMRLVGTDRERFSVLHQGGALGRSLHLGVER